MRVSWKWGRPLKLTSLEKQQTPRVALRTEGEWTEHPSSSASLSMQTPSSEGFPGKRRQIFTGRITMILHKPLRKREEALRNLFQDSLYRLCNLFSTVLVGELFRQTPTSTEEDKRAEWAMERRRVSQPTRSEPQLPKHRQQHAPQTFVVELQHLK